MITNLHTHTVRCRHAEGDEREYIERAISSGIKTLGFSDHSPMPFPNDYTSTFRMGLEETEDYFSTLIRLREEYKKDIKLLIGVEAEYYPAVFPSLMEFLGGFPLDYMILGQHFLDNEQDAHYCGRPTDNEALLEAYVNQTIAGMSTGVFTCLAHPDLLAFIGPEEIYRKHFSRLCLEAKKLDVPLEINLYGIKDGRPYPCDRFFSIAGEVGNSVVIGVDAHQPERLSERQHYEKALDMARRHGLHVIYDPEIRTPRL
ncbi:MAG: histidinol-phosphatase [Clostridiales bacterium]|nr:histidinol-phosphatase [Clostridiales bacterium]